MATSSSNASSREVPYSSASRAVASLYCTWLVVEGGYHVWRRSVANPAARWREVAWNLIGTLTTSMAFAA
ncbi:MAG TPA: hypothetical protein VLC09_18625 [Polyangiaceae bacterium]|nr:hypothetical protein [Polyangiaceae bacterium]